MRSSARVLPLVVLLTCRCPCLCLAIDARAVPPPTLLWDGPSLLANRHRFHADPQDSTVGTAVAALLRVANATAGLCVTEPHIEFAGHNLDPTQRGGCTDAAGGLAAASAAACCELCQRDGAAHCKLWTFYPAGSKDSSQGDGRCCFKYSDAGRRNVTAESGVTSGKGAAPPSVTGPWSVMNKSAVASSGDKHDYLQYAGYYWPCNVNCSVGGAGVPPGPDGCARFCDANNNFCRYTYCHSNCSCAWCNNSTSCTNPKWGVGDCTCSACNMTTGLPWVAHDGYNYPDSGHLDRGQGSDPLFNAVVPLSLAWWYTGEVTYGAKAATLLRTWFLTPATAMNPNLEHADFIPGVGPETGGVVDFARFARVLDCIRLLETGTKFSAGTSNLSSSSSTGTHSTRETAFSGWTGADRSGMRSWVKQMLNWWITSRPGRDAIAGDRNIALTATINAISMALYIDHAKIAHDIATNQSRRLVTAMVDGQGCIIGDMNRPDGFMYCSGDLVDLVDLAVISNKARLGVDLLRYRQNSSTGSISAALAWFLPFCSRGCTSVGHTVKQQVACAHWPFDQIEDMPFSQCKLIYRWAAIIYNNNTLMRMANDMLANSAGAGGPEYYTYGLTVDNWVTLVYPHTQNVVV